MYEKTTNLMPKLNKMLAAWIITTLQEAIQHYLLSF